MRWLFPDPNDTEETRARDLTITCIAAWWGEFVRTESVIRQVFERKADLNLPGWMNDHLQAINPNLMWEFGPAVNCDGHRLVITCESDRALRPLVSEILARAPKISGWEFYGYRLAESLEQAAQSVKGRGGRETAGDCLVNVARGQAGLVDIEFRSIHTTGPDDTDAKREAFVWAESLLGEETLTTRIGKLGVAPLDQKKRFGILPAKPNTNGLIPLNRLKPTVDALITASTDQLPGEPYYSNLKNAGESQQWGSFKLEPTIQQDYARRLDLFVAITPFPKLFADLHSGWPVDSRRFSRCGETFCYLKLDGREGLESTHFADRGDIEDAINAAFDPLNIGGVIGGGTGNIYSYIDLALTDVAAAIPVVRKVLRDGNIHRRSWLLFFDADLADEWVGTYDDTPPPPAEPVKL